MSVQGSHFLPPVLRVSAMQIPTKRFVLRDFEDSDQTAFRAYHADPRYLAFYRPDDSGAEHAETLIQLYEAWASETPRLNYQFAIVSRARADVLVGCCGIRTEDQPPKTGEFGLELAAIHWGRYGYAIEIARAMLNFAFFDLGLEQIVGVTSSANLPVRRLALWFGAEEIESRPGPQSMSAHGWTETVWRITRQTWLSGENARESSAPSL